LNHSGSGHPLSQGGLGMAWNGFIQAPPNRAVVLQGHA
jgi:hypothetical protein